MKNIIVWIIALALSPYIFAEAIKIDPSQEKDMWNSAWTRFFSPKTDVFYDLIVSLNPENSLDFVPTAEQIKKLAPANPNGYGTGMEDGMILGGIMMCAVLDKYEVTKDASLKKYADAIVRGMARCSLSPKARGFVARAVSTSDGKSFFPATSRDQYTHCIHGLWKYYNSPLSTAADKKVIAEICAAVADRMIEKMTPATKYDAQNADGKPSTFGLSRMWNVSAHEAARLPMIYAVAHLVTGDKKYLEEYKKYAKESISQSANFDRNMAPWAQFQMQISLEAMLSFAESESEKNTIRRIMGDVSALAAKRLASASNALSDPKLDLTSPLPNPQERPIQPNGKPDMREFKNILRTPRYFGEMALTMLVRGAEDFDEKSARLLATPIEKIDYDKMSSCAVIFHLAAYWNAKKSGIIE